MAKGTIGERVYRRLLRLYPRDFSDDYGDEMTHLYRDRVRGEGAASVWLALVADLARTAPREQISTLVQDVRHAWRTWRRTPVLALAAVLTLALGVGANTAVFSVVHGCAPAGPCHIRMRIVSSKYSRTIPAPAAGRSSVCRCSTICRGSSAPRASTRWLPSTGGTSPSPSMVTRSASLEAPLPPRCSRCSACAPIVGRPLSAEDEQPGAAPVAVLAESLWVRGFGGDRSVVGRSIVLNGTPHLIVGVVPAVFRELGRTQIGSAGAAQIFVPLTIDTAQSRGNHTLRVVARLRPETSLDRSRDEMHRVAAGMEQEFPSTNRNWGVRIERLNDSMFDPRVRLSLLVLLGAVGVVLLIACANVANLRARACHQPPAGNSRSARRSAHAPRVSRGSCSPKASRSR